MDKRGIELSMNFLVVLVLSLAIFGFGIKFIYTLVAEAESLRDITIEDLDKSISSLVCEGSAKVCIGAERKTIKRDKFDVFGIKIVNIDDYEGFYVDVDPPTPPSPPGYKKDKTPIPSTAANQLIINPEDRRPIEIEKNDDKVVAVGIQVPKSAVSGTYIFNVKIYHDNVPDTDLYVPIQKLYVEVN